MKIRLLPWVLSFMINILQTPAAAQEFNSIRLAFKFLEQGPINPPDPDNAFRVKLLVPVNTESNREGDKITAQVLSPEAFRDDFVEGKVRKSKQGGKLKGRSVLAFSFDTLYHRGTSVPIKSRVKSVINSQGKPNVDEEGNFLKPNHAIAKTVLVAGVGSLIGGLIAGAEGAGIGASIGATASIVLIQFAAKAPHVSFAPGTEFLLIVEY